MARDKVGILSTLIEAARRPRPPAAPALTLSRPRALRARLGNALDSDSISALAQKTFQEHTLCQCDRSHVHECHMMSMKRHLLMVKKYIQL